MSGRLHSEFVYLTPSTGIASSGPATDSDGFVTVDVRGYNVLGIQVDSGNDGAIQIEGVIEQQTDDSAGWRILTGVRSSDQSKMTSYTPTVDWDSDGALIFYSVAGLSGVRLHQTGTPSAGAVTIWGRLSVGAAGGVNVADIEISSVAVELAGQDTGNAAVALEVSTDATFGPGLMVAGNDTDDGLGVHFFTGDTVILPADAIADPTLLPKVLDFGMVYNSTGGQWERLQGDTSGLNVVLFGRNLDDANLVDQLRSDSAGRLTVVNTWNSTLQVDENANDSNKSFSVPAGLDWHVMWIWVEYTAGTTAGTRQLAVIIQDSAGDTIMEIFPGVAPSTISVLTKYMFAPGAADLTAERDSDYISTPLPPTLILPELFTIQIMDQAAIAADSDDMLVQMMVMDRDRYDT